MLAHNSCLLSLTSLCLPSHFCVSKLVCLFSLLDRGNDNWLIKYETPGEGEGEEQKVR